MMRAVLTLLSLALLAAPVAFAAAPPPKRAAPAGAGNASDEARRLHDLFAREWELRLREDPLYATFVGRHEYDDRLPSVARADLGRQAAAARGFLRELDAIDVGKLPPEDQVSAGIFRRQLEVRVGDFDLGAWRT